MKYRKTVAALATLMIASSCLTVPAAAAKPVTKAEVVKLRFNLLNGKGKAGTRKAVIDLVHRTTRKDALKFHCWKDQNGKVLDPNGEWQDADMYGKANPEKTSLGANAVKEKKTWQLKLSWKTGFCYLKTKKGGDVPVVSAARQGASYRADLAARKMKK